MIKIKSNKIVSKFKTYTMTSNNTLTLDFFLLTIIMEKIKYLSQQFWDTFNLEGFLIRKTTVYYQKKSLFLPSTREVSRVTFAALRLPAGKAIPILSSLSLRFLPPSFDLALMRD